MPPKKRGRNGKRSSPQAAGGEGLGALPDEILHHMLSFLPAQDAVRTCVLARRWRHLWKFATGLRVVRQDMDGPKAVKAVLDFVVHFLALRRDSPLDTCELCLDCFKADDVPHMKLVVRHILLCKARVLSLDMLYADCSFNLNGSSLISEHLRKLQLCNIYLEDKCLDLSCCPALETLELDECDLSGAARISSLSLNCLSISNNCYFADSRTHIYVPNLRSLRLEVGEDSRTPVVERMPSLVEASVKLGPDNADFCDYSVDSGFCELDNCKGCYGVNGDTDNCVLQALTDARNLTLMSEVKIFIFRRDLKCCPIFGNLKTLLLNEYWCVPDFSSLTYMLEHSPNLEKLTLQLYCKGPESKVKVKGIPDPTDRSAAMSHHLKTVEVECEVVAENVLNVLKFLTKLGIRGQIDGSK